MADPFAPLLNRGRAKRRNYSKHGEAWQNAACAGASETAAGRTKRGRH
jgi:hypothetical protein